MAKKNTGSSSSSKAATASKPVVNPVSKSATTPAKPAPASKPLTASQAYNKAYSSAGKTAGKKVAQTAAQTAGKTLLKTAGKAVLKRLPYVGAAIGVYELGKAGYDAYKNSKANEKSSVKTNSPKSTSPAPKPSTPVKRNDGLADYMKTVDSTPVKTTTVEKQKGSGSTSGSKGSGTKGVGSSAPKSGSTPSAKTETKSAPKPGIRMSVDKLTPASTKQLEKSKPVDVSYKRTYSDTEKKMQEIMAKGKKADGTMSESAQAKIKALRDKERMAGEKAERQKNRSNRRAIAKSVRAGKFNKRVIAKSAK